jgi:hypothetical protein
VVPTRDRVYALRQGKDGWFVAGRRKRERAVLDLPAGDWSVNSITGNHAWFRGSGVWVECALDEGRCSESEIGPEPPKMTHSGPELGFRLALDEAGQLRLALPHQVDGAGEVLAEGVARLVGVRWVSGPIHRRVQEYLDRTFRGRARLLAPPAQIVVDGDLSDWTAEPAVVDAPWQADSRDGWQGPDDASFAVAAAMSNDKLCFAGRLRDDQLGPDDMLVIHAGPAIRRLRLADPPHDVVVVHEWFGWHFELCMRPPTELMETGRTSLSVAYHDFDGDDPEAVLSTAPRIGDWAAGTLRLADESGLPAVATTEPPLAPGG